MQTIGTNSASIKGNPPVGLLAAGRVSAIGRTYSSIERNTRGEFDYGWKMFIKDVDIKEDGKRNVTVDLPGGRRVTFHYNLQTQNAVTLRAVWEAEPGVYDKLEMAGDNLSNNDNFIDERG